MLKIAICDDQPVELKILEKQLERYQALRGCERADISWFTSSAELVNRLQSGEIYEIFILDMMMPEYNGVEVGRAIRANGLESAIIYLTASAEFALDAISVHPEEYLLKPLDPKALYRALDGVRRRMEKREERYLTVKTREGVEVLPCRKIVCVEHAGRVMRVYTADRTVRESVYLRAPFETLVEPLLRQRGFLQPHRSYLVNLYHVRALQPGGFLTDIGLEIPISRRNAAELKRRYLQFLEELGG